MSLFGGVISISNIYTLLFVAFVVLLLGYALGRITIKGVSLGDAGVFLIALLFGALFFSVTMRVSFCSPLRQSLMIFRAVFR